MYNINQSTALDFPFFAHDENGDPVTGLEDGDFTKKISKAGGAFASMTATVTEREAGWYLLPLSTSHTDTQGILTVYLTATGIKQVNLQFNVGGAFTDVNVAQISGDSAAADNLEAILDGTRAKLYLSQLNIEATGNDAAIYAENAESGAGMELYGTDALRLYAHAGDGIHIYAESNGIFSYGDGGNGMQLEGGNGPDLAFATGSCAIPSLGTQAKTDVENAVLNAALSGHTTAGTAGERLGRIPNAAAGGNGGLPTVNASNQVAGVSGNVVGSIGSLAAQAKADVNAEVDTALADYDPPTKAELDAAQAAIVADIAEVKAETASIQGDTNDIQARLPAALISGRIDASVGDMAADVITAAAIAPDAIGSSELAASAVTEIQSGLSTLTAAQVNTEVDQALADYDPPTKAEMDAGFTALHDISPAEVLAQVDTALDTAIAEPTAPFTWAQASIRKILGWIGALSRNRMTQTGSTTTLRNDANSANIATFAVSDDETTFVSDEAQ